MIEEKKRLVNKVYRKIVYHVNLSNNVILCEIKISRRRILYRRYIYNLLLAIWPILENKVLTECQSSLPNKEYNHFALTAMGILQMAAESVNDLGLPKE